ncbi:MAG: hypothetical protein H6713_32025 [Myxococcales bacterium]|nr:hypothetical protein [Myxococcales bacterium]MCB9754588.1 hypothetical protein [Myxococcales bacterium]
MRASLSHLALGLLLAASCSYAAGPGSPEPRGATQRPDEPPPSAGCQLELRTELTPTPLTWGGEATVALRVANISASRQEVAMARNCPNSDIRVELGGVLFDPTSACTEGACMEDPPPLTFTLAPGESRVVGELRGALGPKLSCMDAELPRGQQEARASARIVSSQSTCAAPQTVELRE